MADDIEEYGFKIKLGTDTTNAEKSLDDFTKEAVSKLKKIPSIKLETNIERTNFTKPKIKLKIPTTSGYMGQSAANKEEPLLRKIEQNTKKLNTTANKRLQMDHRDSLLNKNKKTEKKAKTINTIASGLLNSNVLATALGRLGIAGAIGTAIYKVGSFAVTGQTKYLNKDIAGNALGISGQGYQYLINNQAGGQSVLNSLSRDRLAYSNNGIASYRARIRDFVRLRLLGANQEDVAAFAPTLTQTGNTRLLSEIKAIREVYSRTGNAQFTSNIAASQGFSPDVLKLAYSNKSLSVLQKELGKGNILNQKQTVQAINKRVGTAQASVVATNAMATAANVASTAFDKLTTVVEKATKAISSNNNNIFQNAYALPPQQDLPIGNLK